MRYEWSEDAACKGLNTNIFFGFTIAEEKAAKAICNGCTVKETCLQTAMDKHMDFGIWGGMTEKERDRLRRRNRARGKKSA